ncbi:MAG: hypothetical protein JNM99_05600 [Verrucomicrobiaceae bacterium]|nr:hypothetical protein [Verrucomicrobiaceae bacterium]
MWKQPPNIGGATNAAGELRDQLDAMLRDYEGPELTDPSKALTEEEARMLELRRQAEERNRRISRVGISEEACEMADVLIRFLVDLAVQHEDYDAVRWLSYFSRLGERRVPGDDWASIEDKLTGDERPRAKREWNDMQEVLKRTQPHVSKSIFATVVRRIASDVKFWRFGWFVVGEAKRAEEKAARNVFPRSYFEGGVEGQITNRKIQWLNFLDRWGIKRSNAPEKVKRGDEMQDKWLAIPYPARYDETGSDETLIDEVLIPMFGWWLDMEAEDCAKKKYPKKGALRGRIRAVLGLNKEQKTESFPSAGESVQDGEPS